MGNFGTGGREQDFVRGEGEVLDGADRKGRRETRWTRMGRGDARGDDDGEVHGVGRGIGDLTRLLVCAENWTGDVSEKEGLLCFALSAGKTSPD